MIVDTWPRWSGENEADPMGACVAALLGSCRTWLAVDESDNTILNDPLEGVPIGAHYGMSHAAAAMVMYGSGEGDLSVLEEGLSLLRGVINRWPHDSRAREFHHDFNNFALCLIAQLWEDAPETRDAQLYEEIKAIVVSSSDSPHDTINWLPMRVFVNHKRHQWTGSSRFTKNAASARRLIQRAFNDDGFIEDRLPKGLSFNLQYNVSSVALLAFLNTQGIGLPMDRAVSALMGAIDPTGDINYLGRGCNQIFAWGPWIYLLKVTGQVAEYERACRYLHERIGWVTDGHNLLLNPYNNEKHLWWDYHHLSVYASHLLLWLVLARYETAVTPVSLEPSSAKDTGLVIVRTSSVFAATFAGRKEYLAERGPSIANLWTKQHGTLFKGSFGPWLGAFGMKHLSDHAVMRNFIGPLGVKRTPVGSIITQLTGRLDLEIDDSGLEIVHRIRRDTPCIYNLAVFVEAEEVVESASVTVDGHAISLHSPGTLRGPYGDVRLFESALRTGREWRLHLAL